MVRFHRYTYGLDLVNVKASGEGTDWWAQSVKKCVYSDYVHTDRLGSVVKPGGRVGRLAAQIGYSIKILFSFRAAPRYDGERLGRKKRPPRR